MLCMFIISMTSQKITYGCTVTVGEGGSYTFTVLFLTPARFDIRMHEILPHIIYVHRNE
jgi:hypothetical protein